MFVSASTEKLSRPRDEEIIIDPSHGYRIIVFVSAFTVLSKLVICKECKKQIRFGETASYDLGFELLVQCKCGVNYINSSPVIDRAYEINRRILFVMRMLGVGEEGINLFCGLMDLCQGISNCLYYAALENIHTGAKAVFDLMTQKVLEEEKIKYAEHWNPMSEITISGDGT
ncbi:hypothetical protein KPH14_002833 [Odynerus spinipes]|uniref:Mutator-like transposase domain-containing protein n=1 Tax=Odynerus spinipes TaxID=1348599 RepID=A0AAD9RGH8_9HYME|nr:hypothetical protein KPH14_002833 [Odynerus spinipes]